MPAAVKAGTKRLAVDDTMSNESNGNLTSKPVVRLCHLVKWPDYDGYGFNLHANMNKPGQFIGNVEEGSPAQAAGLKEGDRIVEVNGTNIDGEVHKQVVSRIKQNPNETKLLVVDKESCEYFQTNGIAITGSMSEVVVLKPPIRENQLNGNKPQMEETDGTDSNPPMAKDQSQEQPETENNHSTTAEEEKSPKLNLNMTVNEYRSKLASRKKYDPKKEAMDVKKKHEIIDTL